MKKILRTLLCVVTAGAIFAACGGTSGPMALPSTMPVPVPITEPTATPTVEDLFLDRVAQNTSLRMQVTDAELIQLGWLICDFYTQGGTTDEITTIIIESSLNNGLTRSQIMELATMAGIAVATLCPENSWRV